MPGIIHPAIKQILRYKASSSAFGFNPADSAASLTFSNSNRKVTATAASGGWNVARSTTSRTSGKRYFEIAINSLAAVQYTIGAGLALSTTALTDGGIASTASDLEAWVAGLKGNGTTQVDVWSNNFGTYNTGTSSDFSGSETSLIMGFHADLNANALYLKLNNVNWKSHNPAAGTGGETLSSGKTWYYGANLQNIGDAVTVNSRTADLVYTPESGYTAWDS